MSIYELLWCCNLTRESGLGMARLLARDDVSCSRERGYDGEVGEDGDDRRGSRLDGDASPTKVSFHFARDSSVANALAVRLSIFPLEPAERGLPFNPPTCPTASFLSLHPSVNGSPFADAIPKNVCASRGVDFCPKTMYRAPASWLLGE